MLERQQAFASADGSKPRIGIIETVPLRQGEHYIASLELLQKALSPHVPTFYVHRDTPLEVDRWLTDVRVEFEGDPRQSKKNRQKRFSNRLRWNLTQGRRRVTGRPLAEIDGQCHRNPLLKLLKEHSVQDQLVLPTVNLDTLSSLIAAIEEHGLENIPHLYLRFLIYMTRADEQFAQEKFSRLSQLAAASDRIHVYTENESLRKHLKGQFGFEKVGKVIFQPNRVDPDKQQPYFPNDGVIRIGFLGGRTRKDKGSERLPTIIGKAMMKLRQSNLDHKVQFVVQVSGNPPGKALRKQMEDLSVSRPDQVCIISKNMDLPEFSNLVAGCDIVLLPYSTHKNEQIWGSGVLFDAVINGVPVVCTPVDTLVEFVTPDTAIVADGDQDLADAIVHMVSNMSAYKTGAMRLSQDYQDLWCNNDIVNSVLDRVEVNPNAPLLQRARHYRFVGSSSATTRKGPKQPDMATPNTVTEENTGAPGET